MLSTLFGLEPDSILKSLASESKRTFSANLAKVLIWRALEKQQEEEEDRREGEGQTQR